jgi:nucleotidyltransferase/DNA polymerase involved in DNA repair
MTIACLLTSHLPIQVEQQPSPILRDHPLVVGGRSWDPGAVLDACPITEAAGVQPGMRLSRAEGLCPTARFLPAAEAAYHAAHQALKDTLRSFSSRVETAELGLLFADADGADDRWARHPAEDVSKVTGLGVQLGLANARFTAEQAARAA